MRVSTFSGWFEIIDKLSIYRPINCINFEIINGSINWPNRLDNRLASAKHEFLLPKLKGMDI